MTMIDCLINYLPDNGNVT